MSIWWPLQQGEVYIEDGKPAEHWVLEMVAEFASVQTGIEAIVSAHLRRMSPGIADKITKKHLTRLSDEDRWDYLKALASDAGYEGKLLNSASDAFWRCKRLRDLVGHYPTGLVLVRSQEQPDFHYRVPREGKFKKVPDPLTPQTFRQSGADCRWLHAFIEHIGSLAGIPFIRAIAKVDPDGRPQPWYVTIEEPPMSLI